MISSMTTVPLSDPLAEGVRLIETAGEEQLEIFLLGGVAIRLRTPEPLLERSFNDIDIVASRAAGREVTGLLERLGYAPDREFNAVNGRTRMLFRDEFNARDLDVLIGEFEMCHALPILERARLFEPTVPLAELLLTKLQIVELNRKDVIDVYNLLHAHDVRDALGIDAERVGQLCGRDWGLWRTVTGNLDRITDPALLPDVSDAQRMRVAHRVAALKDAITTAKKSRKWQLRSRIGDRVRWYEEPEEAH